MERPSMNQDRVVQLSSPADAENAWLFWTEALESFDAGKMVTGVNQSRVALNQVYKQGFQKEPMEDWLQKWPTLFGLSQYRRVYG